MEDNTPLNHYAEHCAELFRGLSTSTLHDDDDWIEDRAADFMLWAHGLNALKTGRSSLDYRLRNRSDIRDIVQGLLGSLAGVLSIYRKNYSLDDTQLPHEAAHHDGNVLDDDSTSDSFSSGFPGNDESGNRGIGKKGELSPEETKDHFHENKFYIQTHLKQLAAISIAIRAFGNTTRHLKADEYLKEHSENSEYVELRSHLTTLLILGRYENDLLSTLPHHLHKSRLPQTVELIIRKWVTDPARLTPLQRRLIEANVVRRNRILCAKRVPENPSSATQQPNSTANAQPKPRSDAGSLRAPVQETRPEPKTEVQRVVERENVSVTATDLDSKFVLAAQPRSENSVSVFTSITHTGDSHDYPARPAMKTEVFQCPYCIQFLSSDYNKISTWREHVKRDLSPYSCIYDSCPRYNEFYDTKEAWFNHLTTYHQTERWVCDECTFQDEANDEVMFEHEDMWKRHMSSVHTEKYNASQASLLASFSRRQVPILARCPLCPRPAGMSQPLLDDHIAEHLHFWALRALPWDEDGAGGQDPYSSNAPGHPSYLATLSTPEHSDWSQSALSESKLKKPTKSLKKLLAERRVDMTYDTEERSETWVPFDAIEDIFGSDKGQNSLRIISGDNNKLQAFVTKSKRLWALLVHVNRLVWLESFCDAEFGDSLFPIKRIGNWNLRSRSSNKIVAMPGKSDDDETAFDSIEDQQWQFFVPIFGPKSFACGFDYHCRMPFIREFRTEDTNFSAVTEFVIHRKHLDLHKNDQIGAVVDKNGNPHVAVKELTSAKSLGWTSFKRLVENEASVLLHFGKQDHPHFIQTIARYTQGSRHFFIFPWAKGGNLRNFWKNQPSLSTASLNFSRTYCVGYMRWFFEQLRGLSGAIEKLHNPPNQPGGSCRHGDLKPENILCFCTVVPEAGDLPTDIKLVIADAGHARIHEKATELRGEVTTTQAGTQAYTPPEVETQRDKARPRRYDIWSLGCLYLEFLIWILYGNDGLEAFHSDIKRAHPYTFYRINPDVSLKPEVSGWIEEIKKDPRCKPIMSTAVGRLIDLIEKRLLVVSIGGQPAEATQSQSSSVNEQPTSTGAGPFKMRVRAPTLHFNQTPPTERAHAIEMLEKMDQIVKDALAQGPSSLAWINWDGIAEAAKRGIPRPTKNLSSTGISSLGAPKGNVGASAISERYMFTPLDNNWKYDFDDNTASKVVLQSPERKEKKYHNSKLCQRCQELRILSPNGGLSDSLAALEKRSRSCDLCRLVCKSIVQLAIRSQETVRLVRLDSGLSIVSGESQWGPILSLCTTSDSKLLRSNGIQPGFPHRLVAGSTTHIKVISEWIGQCNQTHHCRRETNFNPTRLLHVGNTDCRSIKLVTNFEHQRPVQYAALSHRWGSPDQKPPTTVDFAATTWDNLHVIEDANGVEDGAFPKTFQDAITITRKLGIQYLWIDSLCILQKTGEGDDRKHKEDWDRESQRMEKVFSAAYFTIAASCAQHRFDGFLKERKQRDFVTMTASDGAQFDVCQVIDDFEHDVEQGELNKRGWVLQERALSCRTVHFTETQTYWECGQGIKCETFTKTENRKAAFLGDSNFPHSVEAFKHGRQIQHYQDLYERYSSLGLSNQEDRPVAIAGLEQRLMTALKSTGGYGIFQSNFHRDLLWHRKRERPTLERIKFGQSAQVPPSWSWMAFGGEIRYMNAPLGGVDWNRKVISPFKVPNEGDSSTFKAQHPIEFQAPVLRLKGEVPKLLLQDEPSRQLDIPLRCVVIGSNKDGSGKSRQHYAIILSSIRTNGSHQFYERVGVAYLTEGELSNVENEQETEVGTIR